jgi:hypothetical protein
MPNMIQGSKVSGPARLPTRIPQGVSVVLRCVSASASMLVAGFLMAPVCLFGLLYHQAFIWVVCPQALVVMFLRQSQHGYDSLGAADYPDLAVGLLYYPLIGWILARASRRGLFRRVVVRVALWHCVAIGLAVGAAEMRNQIWGF